MYLSSLPRAFRSELQLKGLAGKADFEEGHGRPAAAFDSLSPEARFPHSVERLAGGHAWTQFETCYLSHAVWTEVISSPRPYSAYSTNIAPSYRDHYDRIWRLLNLELWHRVCLEGESHNGAPSDPGERNLASIAG